MRRTKASRDDGSAGDTLGLARLASAADALRDAAGELAADLETKADELVERVGSGEFRLAFCGGFSNGKSTLINALLSTPALPIGVLPVTAIPTEIVAGPYLTAAIELSDGTSTECPLQDLARWVSETGHPQNRRGVHRAVLTSPSPLLASGMTMVDTPGLESVFGHNDDTALSEIRDAEGAVVVLSADAPLTAAERRLLDVVAGRSSATFFVLNRIDHLTPAERDEAVAFVEAELHTATGGEQRVFPMSARDVFDAVIGNKSDAAASSGLAAFREAIAQFVAVDIVEARLVAFARFISQLADEIEDRDALERAALALGIIELAERIQRFDDAAGAERRALDDDRLLLAGAVNDINAELTEWLANEGRVVPDGSDAASNSSRSRCPCAGSNPVSTNRSKLS